MSEGNELWRGDYTTLERMLVNGRIRKRQGMRVKLARREIYKKERTKSQFEAMKKSAKVKEMMSELKQKSKRKFKIYGPS